MEKKKEEERTDGKKKEDYVEKMEFCFLWNMEEMGERKPCTNEKKGGKGE